MHIAIVLYGQPRNYLKGYHNITEFIKTQYNCTFDFFYHCWVLNENETYKHSPWRNISSSDLCFNTNTSIELQKLYKPISHEIENQNDVMFEPSIYKDTIAFNNNTDKNLLNNINNTLFQMYSRNKARNILDRYLEKMGETVHYDFVMMLRFDISNMPSIQFNELDKLKVYISNIHCPRKIIADNCIIAPIPIFLQWFNIYDRLKDIINNTQLLEDIIKLNETIYINAEELIFAKYIFQYKNTDNISYFNGGNI
jgi:hypothetical protein